MAELPVWGIHITTASVRGVKVESIDGELQVVAHDQADFADDIEDVNSLDRHLALVHALAVFMKRHDLSRSRVMVSVDASTSFNRFLSAPMVENENLMRILAYEAQQQIPFDLEQVYWDHKVLEVREADREADVLLFALKKEVVDERLRRLQKIRFPVDGVQLGPVALYNFAVRERLVRDGQVLVSVDFDRTDVIACLGRRLWFRSLPLGLHPMFGAVASAYGVTHRQAVKILRGELAVDDDGPLREARRVTAERLCKEIARMIAYFGGAVPDLEPKSVIFLPGSPLTPPLGPMLQKLTGLEVHPFKSFRQIPVAMPELSPNLAGLAHATGLALQLMGQADIDIKLYPPTLERVITGRRVFWAASVVLLFVMVAAMWMMVDSSRATVEEADAELGQKVQEMDGLKKDFNAARREHQIQDQIRPLMAAGHNRLLPLKAADSLLRHFSRATSGMLPDDRLYLVSLETKIMTEAGAQGLAEARSGWRQLELIVGQIDSGDEADLRQSITNSLWPELEADSHFSGLAFGKSFVAPQLRALPPAEGPGEVLRRRFRMLPVTMTYRAQAQGEKP